jgi:phage gpG-like protein
MAGAYQVEIEGLDELRRKLRSEVAGPPAHRFLQRSADAVQREAKKLTPFDTARLKTSITTEVDSRTPVPQYARIGTNVKYGLYVHEGRKPGKYPPAAPIAAWIKRKRLNIPTFTVQRAIARKGIAPKPFLKDGLEAAIPSIQRNVPTLARELEKAYRDAR